MEEEPKLAPFVLKPKRINNYTHLIALLKVKQSKYKDYFCSPITTKFNNVLGKYKESLDLDVIYEGFLHEKLKDNLVDFEDKLISDLNRSIICKIKEIKIENDQRIYSNKIGNIKDSEELLFLRPTAITFKDELLYDLYLYINKKSNPILFLQNSYLKYMLRYFAENNQDGIKFDADNLTCEILKKIVEKFVKMKFNSEEYKIEIYESRYLWAEIFVYFRIGRSDLALEIINDHEIYFEFMTSKFKSIFKNFLNGKKSNFVHNFRNEDRFKKFMYEITDDRVKSDGLIINTAEDYLWMKLVSEKEIKNDVNEFGNTKIKFMISLFSMKYLKAIDILLKSDFDIVPKFFLLRELCLEQSLDYKESDVEYETIFNKSSRNIKPELRTRILVDESSSTASLMSTHEQPTYTISPVFLNFLFSLVSKVSTKEHKVKLVEMLKSHNDYYNVVPIYIVKFDLYDILGKSKDSISNVEFALDDKVASKVLQILKEKGEKSKIINLYNLIDDVGMVQFLIEAIEEAILIDETVNVEIVEKYLKNKISKDSVTLENFYGFYKFVKNPTVKNLKTLILFDQNSNLKPFKFVIKKIFSKAVDIVKAENDKIMARTLFKLCGLLDLNEDCTSKISRDLVSLV